MNQYKSGQYGNAHKTKEEAEAFAEPNAVRKAIKFIEVVEA